jgi:chemotaxis protein MotB
VVKFLISRGIPANRLVAAGFGENQPIEAGASEEAFAKNRRIELKLTER